MRDHDSTGAVRRDPRAGEEQVPVGTVATGRAPHVVTCAQPGQDLPVQRDRTGARSTDHDHDPVVYRAA